MQKFSPRPRRRFVPRGGRLVVVMSWQAMLLGLSKYENELFEYSMHCTFFHVVKSGFAKNPSANSLIRLCFRIFFSASSRKRLVRDASHSSSSSFSLFAFRCVHRLDFRFGLLSRLALAWSAWLLGGDDSWGWIWVGASSWIGWWNLLSISLILCFCFCHCRRAGMLGLCFRPNRFFASLSWGIGFLFWTHRPLLFLLVRSLLLLGWGVQPPFPSPFRHLDLPVLVFQFRCSPSTHSQSSALNLSSSANSTDLQWWQWLWALGLGWSRFQAACLARSDCGPWLQSLYHGGIGRLRQCGVHW